MLIEKWKRIVVIVIIISLSSTVVGIRDPSEEYCSELGYKFIIKKGERGQYGICQFPDNSTCRAWDFIKGKCGKEWSYCERKGYGMKTVSDRRCSYSRECAVCVLSDGREIEVLELMELMKIGICNKNNICDPNETYRTCPVDCPSGVKDDYCDRVKDGICDPDCPPELDLDCEVKTTTPTTLPPEKPKDLGDYLPYLLALFIIILLTFLIHRRQQGIKRRLKGEEKLRGWIEGQLRAGEDPEFLKKALEREGTDQAIVDEIMRKV